MFSPSCSANDRTAHANSSRSLRSLPPAVENESDPAGSTRAAAPDRPYLVGGHLHHPHGEDRDDHGTVSAGECRLESVAGPSLAVRVDRRATHEVPARARSSTLPRAERPPCPRHGHRVGRTSRRATSDMGPVRARPSGGRAPRRAASGHPAGGLLEPRDPAAVRGTNAGRHQAQASMKRRASPSSHAAHWSMPWPVFAEISKIWMSGLSRTTRSRIAARSKSDNPR